MRNEIVELQEDVSNSPLYSEDLAPVPASKRTWGMFDLAALWVGMAVCVPTYLMASSMIIDGLSWWESLLIIILGNLIITIPMVLNGHAGVKYGIPFPVVGRAAFGTNGIHIASLVRGIVACGWFGIQTWIGGLAIYAIWNAITGSTPSSGLDAGQFISFGLFWLLNVFFIWKGTEGIKWLEKFAAPILVGIGIALIVWGAVTAGGFGVVLDQSTQLSTPTSSLRQENNDLILDLNPIRDKNGVIKATDFQLLIPESNGAFESEWNSTKGDMTGLELGSYSNNVDVGAIVRGDKKVKVTFRLTDGTTAKATSVIDVGISPQKKKSTWTKIVGYLLWLTAMVGFWATMAISIADITRYTSSQRNQVMGQFLGLPLTMALFSFVGIFVTCAALINFDDVLISEDAPWDPVTLLSKFENPVVVVVAQIFMLIATLSTNIAANVIAPANAFSNLFPKMLSFRSGGILTAILGIVICPWWLLNSIMGLLLFVSGLLGPVLAILICDYFVIRKKELNLAELFKVDGIYSFGGSGVNMKAMIALVIGILVPLLGFFIPSLGLLYSLSWFTGFIAAFIVYYILMPKS